MYFLPVGWGAPKELVHLLMQFLSLYSSNIKLSETYFFDIVIT